MAHNQLILHNNQKDDGDHVVPDPPKPLLPGTIASLVSFAAATSSLGLRIGGFFGRSAINAARIGTLGSIDLARVVLEALLFNAAQDVIETSNGYLGRAAAESMLDQSLASLHGILTSSSYLVSAGFQVGSTSLTGALNLSNALIAGIDAVLGDTETSKAIAAIVVLVQKEFGDPQTKMERVGLLDFYLGVTAFALLQRWEYTRTEQQYVTDGVVENVWDVVILEDTVADFDDTATLHEEDAGNGPEVELGTAPSSRPMSVISSHVDMEHLDGPVTMDDNSSIISQRFGTSQPEHQFRQRLSQTLKAGTTVRVSAHSQLRNVVTIEVDSEDSEPADIEPPPGYNLVALHRTQHRPQSFSYVFQQQRKRLRRGSFEIEHPRDTIEGEPGSATSGQEAPFAPEPTLQPQDEGIHLATAKRRSLDGFSFPERPIGPNQARTRMPLTARNDTTTPSDENADGPIYGGSQSPARVEKKVSLRKSFKNNPSYNKLVDFWNHMPSTRSNRRMAQQNMNSQPNDHNGFAISRPSSPALRRSNTGASASFAPFTLSRGSVEIERPFSSASRPVSQRSQTLSLHRRGDSGVFSTAANASSLSLVSQGLHADDLSVPQQLNRAGCLAGQYPEAPFAENVARFARFANAAYGAAFLRLTGADKSQVRPETDNTLEMHPSEHHSFTTYTGLPSASVLVSSFVDPVGGAHSFGKEQGGLPLTHYVAFDHESKAVVVTLRGTLGFEDVLTDITCDYTNLNWQGKPYYVHAGMLASARRLVTLHGSRLIATLKAALEEFQDYGLILCGHSLGGAVAALLAILIAEPNPHFAPNGDSYSFMTASPFAASVSLNPADALAHTLPPGRPVHAYAFGPAAPLSPALSHVTRRLVTTVINNNDLVPYLSLGNLRDHQRMALEFKNDTENAKAEVRRRVWQGLKRGLTSRAGLGSVESFWGRSWFKGAEFVNNEGDDDWPWATLQSLRNVMTAPKLVPPGEVFIIEKRSALRRFAFTNDGEPRNSSEPSTIRSYRPASQVRVTYVRDVAERFQVLRYAGSMFTDHLPMRYETALQALERGVG